jgi:hypothetical protein
MMRLYPCGFFMAGVTAAPDNIDTADGNGRRPGVRISQIGRSISRMLADRFSSVLEMRFSVPVRVDTICALGPCTIERAEVGHHIAHPYPTIEHGKPEPTLFVYCTRVLDAGERLLVQVRCRPELFMFDADPEALAEELEREQRAFRDAKGNEYVGK